MTLPHALTDSQIDILRLARGGHRPPAGRHASPHRQDCALLLALGLIERRRGALALTARGGSCLAAIDEAREPMKNQAGADAGVPDGGSGCA